MVTKFVRNRDHHPQNRSPPREVLFDIKKGDSGLIRDNLDECGLGKGVLRLSREKTEIWCTENLYSSQVGVVELFLHFHLMEFCGRVVSVSVSLFRMIRSYTLSRSPLPERTYNGNPHI